MTAKDKAKPNRRTVAATIRGSVPDGKLKRAQILLSSAKYGEQQIAGFTEYGDDRKTVVKLGAPSSDDAAGITIRGHEGRHATRHKRTRPKPMTANEAAASQIVDDVNIETTPLPDVNGEALRMYRRAHLATAMRDLRSMLRDKRKVERGEIPDSVEVRNNRLLNSTRTKAILEHYGKGLGISYRGRTGQQARKALVTLKQTLGAETSRALHTVIEMAKKPRSRARAISMLALLLETAPSESEYEDAERKIDSSEGILGPPKLGDAFEGRMTVKELRPRTVHTAKERKVSVKYAPDGVHINPTRYVPAIVSGDANGMFSRRIRRKPGGTVVIDASGSMGVSNENLSALLKLIPTATVGYYSGHDGRGTGVLSIYAMNGLRFSGELPDDTLLGGNAVDLPAVRWLLRQPKPWHLVSDLGFVGGNLGSEIVAHALVQRARDRGELTVHNSLDAAFEAFGGKGELPD